MRKGGNLMTKASDDMKAAELDSGRRVRRRISAGLLAAAVAGPLAAPAMAQAQDYPSDLVRIIVPFPPGGGVDIMARAVAAELGRKWNQKIIVENKAGAGSIIGAQQVARSKPDGLTLMATVNPTLVSNRFLYKNLAYDPARDFAPITLMVQSDQMIVGNAGLPFDDLPGLIAAAKKEPKSLNYGSFAMGSQPHLTFELLKQRESIDLLHVPYNGVAPLMTALGGGTVHLTTVSVNVATPLIQAGKIKPIAVAGRQRVPQFPDVKTTAETGQPYLLTSIWYGLFAPAGTPADVVGKIQRDVKEVLSKPEFAESHATSKGLRVVASTPQELARTIQEESDLVAGIVKAAGIEPQ